ncbi:hypothetical protein DFP72DRAFT_870594, partial [Ephemerocybe angulata]
ATQIVLQSFADRTLILVTQIGKVGNLIQASLPSTTPLSTEPSDTATEITLPEPSPAIQLTPLLGSAPSDHYQTLYSLYTSQIATIVWESPAHDTFDGSRKSIVVGLALKKAADAGAGCELSEDERATFQGIMRMLQDMLKGGSS